jgi:hypothetical protein
MEFEGTPKNKQIIPDNEAAKPQSKEDTQPKNMTYKV